MSNDDRPLAHGRSSSLDLWVLSCCWRRCWVTWSLSFWQQQKQTLLVKLVVAKWSPNSLEKEVGSFHRKLFWRMGQQFKLLPYELLGNKRDDQSTKLPFRRNGLCSSVSVKRPIRKKIKLSDFEKVFRNSYLFRQLCSTANLQSTTNSRRNDLFRWNGQCLPVLIKWPIRSQSIGKRTKICEIRWNGQLYILPK